MKGTNGLVEDGSDGVVVGESDIATVRAGRGNGSNRYAVVRPSAEGSISGRRRKRDGSADGVSGDAHRAAESSARGSGAAMEHKWAING